MMQIILACAALIAAVSLLWASAYVALGGRDAQIKRRRKRMLRRYRA